MPHFSPAASVVTPGVFALLEGKIRERQQRGETVLPLQIGDTYLEPPRESRVALFQEATANYRYGPIQGAEVLREAIAKHLGGHLSAGDQVHIGFGATHALFSSVRSFLGHGDDVLIATPTWPLTKGVFHAAGARPVEVDVSTRLLLGESFDLSAELEAKRTPETRALYIASPNNPDGFVWPENLLRSLFAYAEKHDLWIVSDEVYRDYVYEGAHVSMLSVDPSLSRTVVIGSLSKSHALAGYRLGYAIANAEVVRRARRVSTHTGFNVPLVLQEAGARAFTGSDWIAEARALYKRARAQSAEILRAHGLPFVSGDGGTYHFVDLTKMLGGRPMEEMMEHLLHHGILVAPGASTGSSYAGWVRICFTSVPLATLTEGIHAFSVAALAFGSQPPRE
ncbi:MAG: pyridoxal phosphate-dependent aminotransferase [Polyangiaceae bacterium]|nr:pyridoxal phosphate-dependent aminotransferase [Polyangiaceae bacterium]